MRLTRIHLYLLGGLLLILLCPIVLSQPDPGRGKKGKGMKMDPNAFWDQIAQGKESVNVNEVQFPPQMERFSESIRQRWSAFLQQKGITTGIMTRELYLEQSQQPRQDRGAFGKGPPSGKGSPDGKGAPSTNPKEDDAKIEEEARRWFTMVDTNKDGVIDREEAARGMAARMLRDFDRYDTNLDGKISVDEFIEAYRDEQGRRGRGSRAVMIQGTAPPEEERRPVVYRVGKLPKELPVWFAQLDRDKDGQVGLYEWKAAGRATPEFLAMDINRDGFLTAEEVLRFQKAQRKTDAAKGGPPGRPGSGDSTGSRGVGLTGAGIGSETTGTDSSATSATTGTDGGKPSRTGGGGNRRSRRSPR